MNKIVLKTIYLVPFYLAILILYNFILNIELPLFVIIVAPIIAAGAKVFSNLFDYNYYNDMDEKDYLESNHSTTIEYNNEKWQQLKSFTKVQNFEMHMTSETETQLFYTVTFNILKAEINSELSFTKIDEKIKVNIKKKVFTFLPDKTKNYQIIRKIETL